MKSRIRTLTIAAAVWTLVALLFAGQLAVDAAYSGRPLRKSQTLVLALAGWYGWALLSPLVIWLARRLRPTRRGVAMHAVLSIVLTVAKIAMTTEILRASGMPQRAIALIANIPLSLAAYWAIAGATWAIDAHVRATRLESSLAEARLALLRSQLQPHFLFNALHALSELMHEDVEAADRMVTRLSDLLRASLDASSEREVPLHRELDLVARYVEIERVRLGDRLRFDVDVDPRTLDMRVPAFILQPIVENAIRFAVAPRREGGSVSVRVMLRDERVILEVEDDGPGFRDDVTFGIGLSNVSERVERLELNRGTGAKVTLRP